MIYECPVVNRPIVVKRGFPGLIETNLIQAYVGEWAVFRLPLESGNHAEFRIPIEDAIEEGLVKTGVHVAEESYGIDD